MAENTRSNRWDGGADIPALLRRRAGDGTACPPVAIVERRLVRNLLSYWERRRGEREFPSLQDIDPAEIAELWPSCFVLDTASNHRFPYFRYLGRSLARHSGTFLSGKRDWTLSLLDKAVYRYREAVERREPVLVEEELTLYDGTMLLFRSALLPLSDDQQTINFILGAADGKLVSAPGN